jgi:transposase
VWPPCRPALREVVEAYEAMVTAIGTALKALEGQLAGRAPRDSRVARLTTIPGVGPVSAQTLVGTVDTIARFPSAKKLVAYAGLAPRVRASGDRVEYGPITKEGRSEIRATWVQAATPSWRSRPPARPRSSGGVRGWPAGEARKRPWWPWRVSS